MGVAGSEKSVRVLTLEQFKTGLPCSDRFRKSGDFGGEFCWSLFWCVDVLQRRHYNWRLHACIKYIKLTATRTKLFFVLQNAIFIYQIGWM